MKITKLFIEDFQQFQNFELDLTYPADHPTKAGKPLDKVCFIGKNGTGKTTILEILASINNKRLHKLINMSANDNAFIEIKNDISHGLYLFASNRPPYYFFFEEDWKKLPKIQKGIELIELMEKMIKDEKATYCAPSYRAKDKISIYELADNASLKIYIPSESSQNNLLTTNFFPRTTLNNAMPYLTSKIPNYHEISYENVADFWNLVIYQVKRREEIRLELSEKPENQNKTLQQFRQEFEAQYPDFLHILSEEWERILDRAGLYFDYASAKNPVQLIDNLEAYIKDKFKHEKIAYYQLSSGIRHFIFKIGYLKALFFNRQVPSAIAMIDEPENSLFPNLLYDMVDIYQSIAPNTQFFFATHSPIIAGQFEPCERIILDFDDTGKVVARKGTAPEGDDPNDVLRKDFGLESVFGRKGREQRERYLELKSLIKSETDDTKKDQYIEELMKIGNLYHF